MKLPSMKPLLLSKAMQAFLYGFILTIGLVLTQTVSAAVLPTAATNKTVPAKLQPGTAATDKPKPSLLPAVPLSRQFFAAPNPSSFETVYSRAGKYQLQLPKSFGVSPLAAAEKLDDVALIRSHEQLLVATNVLDHSDALHYKATESLPDFQQSVPVLAWDQPSSGRQLWHCQLSRLHNYQDNLTILRAVSKVSGLTYEIIFLMPSKNYANHLIEALYTINSFAL